jgi:hypothetical protein
MKPLLNTELFQGSLFEIDPRSPRADDLAAAFRRARGYWKADLDMHFEVAVAAIAARWGVEFVDGELPDALVDATQTICDWMDAQVRTRRVHFYLPAIDTRPDFCVRTAQLTTERDEARSVVANAEAQLSSSLA